VCPERLVLLSFFLPSLYRRYPENVLVVDLKLCLDSVNFEGVE